MAKLQTGGLVLEIVPTEREGFERTTDCWNWYRISVTVTPRGGTPQPLFNPALIEDPFKTCTDTNAIGEFIRQAFERGGVIHFDPMGEPNLNLGIYPGCVFPNLKGAYIPREGDSALLDCVTVILQFDTVEFDHEAHTLDGPGLVFVVDRAEFESFSRELFEEERAILGPSHGVWTLASTELIYRRGEGVLGGAQKEEVRSAARSSNTARVGAAKPSEDVARVEALAAIEWDYRKAMGISPREEAGVLYGPDREPLRVDIRALANSMIDREMAAEQYIPCLRQTIEDAVEIVLSDVQTSEGQTLRVKKYIGYYTHSDGRTMAIIIYAEKSQEHGGMWNMHHFIPAFEEEIGQYRRGVEVIYARWERPRST